MFLLISTNLNVLDRKNQKPLLGFGGDRETDQSNGFKPRVHVVLELYC